VSATTSRTGDVPSTRKTTAIPRVRYPTQTDGLDPISWPRHGVMTQLRLATVVTTWQSLPSLRWRHVFGRSPTSTTSSPTSRSTMAAPTPTSGCQGGRRQLRPHGLLPVGDGRRTVALAQQPPGGQHHIVGRLVPGFHVELPGEV
jgi:hypothetical protein